MKVDIKLIRYLCYACILIAAVVFSGLVTQRAGFAQQRSVILEVDSATVEPGGTVVIPVTIDSGSNLVGAMTISVNYNAAELTVSNCTKVSSLVAFCNAGTAGSVIWTGADPSGIAGTTTLVELTVEAGNLPTSTVSELQIEVATLADTNGASYSNRTLTNGQITIGSATARPTVAPTDTPTEVPPTNTPTVAPTDTPTQVPTTVPTNTPTSVPPTNTPTVVPTSTVAPTNVVMPTNTAIPTNTPTPNPTSTLAPTNTALPTTVLTPTVAPSDTPTPVVTATTATETPTPVTPTAVATPAGLQLSAQVNEDIVDLTWTFEADRQTQWFRVYRSNTANFEEAEEVTINFIPAHVTGTRDYEFKDNSEPPSGTYFYWIEQVKVGAPTKQHGPASIVISNSISGQGALYLPIISSN